MFVWWNLFLQVRLIWFVKRPYIVLIIGWSEKSILRQKLAELCQKYWLHYNRSYRHYNTWFGVALNFLDLPSAYSDYSKWIWIYILSWIKFLKHLIYFPKFVILEGWIDVEGEADKFIYLLKPNMIFFVKPNHIFQDDFDKLDIIHREMLRFVQYLNQKWEKFPSLYKEVNLEKIVAEDIKNKISYVWLINKVDQSELQFIKDKLRRKIIVI